MKVLIIGGAGFIGPPLERRLVTLGHEVAVFHGGRSRADLPPAVEHFLGDRHDFTGHSAELRPRMRINGLLNTGGEAEQLAAYSQACLCVTESFATPQSLGGSPAFEGLPPVFGRRDFPDRTREVPPGFLGISEKYLDLY
jgi:hypothetical protein